jgi:hypothetical protein
MRRRAICYSTMRYPTTNYQSAFCRPSKDMNPLTDHIHLPTHHPPANGLYTKRCRLHIGPELDRKQPRDSLVPARGSQVQRRPPLVIPAHPIGANSEQPRHDGLAPAAKPLLPFLLLLLEGFHHVNAHTT